MLTDPALVLTLLEAEKAALTAVVGRVAALPQPVDLQPIADGIKANTDLANTIAVPIAPPQ